MLKLIIYPRTFAEADEGSRDPTTNEKYAEMAVEKESQTLASQILDRLRTGCPDLRAIVIETRRNHQDCFDFHDVLKFGYLRVLQTDLCGRVSAAAAAIAPHMIKHYEPLAQILDNKQWLEL